MSLPLGPRFLLTSRARIRLGIAAVGAAVAIGTIVFHVLEGWSIVDSLYVSAQTLTTVGFGDIVPRTVYGRVFATVFC
jgi:voltage-gated potassium channel